MLTRLCTFRQTKSARPGTFRQSKLSRSVPNRQSNPSQHGSALNDMPTLLRVSCCPLDYPSPGCSTSHDLLTMTAAFQLSLTRSCPFVTGLVLSTSRRRFTASHFDYPCLALQFSSYRLLVLSQHVSTRLPVSCQLSSSRFDFPIRRISFLLDFPHRANSFRYDFPTLYGSPRFDFPERVGDSRDRSCAC